MIQNYTDKRPRCVYGYFDEENMVAYIGLTVNKKQRHYSHKNGVFSSKSSKSPVYEYFTSQNKDVPEPIYLADNLTIIEAQEKEDYYIKFYKERGYTLLNKGKTGIGCGSIGFKEIWNEESVRKEASKYHSKIDFCKNSGGAYKWACSRYIINDLFNDIHKSWDEESVRKEALKYKNWLDFSNRCSGAYHWARKHQINDLFNNTRVYWDEESVRKEASKYKSKKEFEKGCNRAYQWAVRNNFTNELFNNIRNYWDEESVRKEALKYRNKYEFEKKCGGAYHWARRHHILNELFK